MAVFVMLGALMMASCASLALVYRPRIAVPDGLTETDVKNAITSTIQASRYWMLESSDSGKIVATINVRQHQAKVNIDFDSKIVKVDLVSSRNLDQRGDRIHENVNNWLSQLETEIRKELNIVKFRK